MVLNYKKNIIIYYKWLKDLLEHLEKMVEGGVEE